MCPYMPYNGLTHRKQRVRRVSMLSVISPGGFVPLTTVGPSVSGEQHGIVSAAFCGKMSSTTTLREGSGRGGQGDGPL